MAANLTSTAKTVEKHVHPKPDSRTVWNSKSSVQGICQTLSSYWKRSLPQPASVASSGHISAQDQTQDIHDSLVIGDKQPSSGSTENNTTSNVTDLSSDSNPDYEATSVSISTEWADAIENSEHAECHLCDNHDNFENSDLDATLMEQETWLAVVQ